MFERRLKICLGILLGVMSVLLLRAFHLQVVTRGAWVQAAEDFKKKAQYIETTRGRILDAKGHELAVDDAAMDVCVDYRAISRDAAWINKMAINRATSATTDWSHMPKAKREVLIASAEAQVKDDINKMFVRIAKETGRDPEQVEELCRQIDLHVSESRRKKQYDRYEEAQKAHPTTAPQSWYERWLAEDGRDGPSVDDFDQPQGDDATLHPLVRNISSQAYLNLSRQLPQCPGMELRATAHRRYPYGKAGCHLLGTVTTADEKVVYDPSNHDADPLLKYRPNDAIGNGGLEALCEPSLRGVRGRGYKVSGADDQLQVESSPVPGKDVKTTIDIELQDQIQKMFEHMPVPSNKAKDERDAGEIAMHGAAVVIDIKTSAVRAMASYPDYDPNTLSDNYESLIMDATLDAPLLNRATQSQLEPGSTIKPVVGISAITQGLNVPNYGVMSIQTGIHCTGYLVLHNHKMPNGRCWVASKFFDVLGGQVANHPVPTAAPHRGVYGNPDGYLCFADALERSCNVYFETLGDAFGVQGLSYWYDHFGLGRETGLGIAEARGYLPIQDPSHDPSIAWFSGIGQVGVRVTPLQMANVAATIARDGIWMRPRLVDDGYALKPYPLKDGRQVQDVVDLKLNKEALAAARDGMFRVVNSPGGTGPGGRMDDLLVAGKTGTAQAAEIKDVVKDADGHVVCDAKGKPVTTPRDPASIDHPTATPWYRGWGDDGKSLNHAWFIGFAPANHPQVAFAVMVQYGGSGGFLAAHTARQILTACIEHGYIESPRH